MIDARTNPLEDIVFRKITLAAGFGAGYVLGAKAGRQRYEQIMQKVDELRGKPVVQDLTQSVTSSASAAAGKAKSTVNEKVSSVSGSSGGSSSTGSSSTGTTSGDRVVGLDESGASLGSDVPDPLGTSIADPLGTPLGAPTTSTSGGGSSTSGTSGTGSRTRGTPPMPGAAPSSTAPDVL